MGIKALSTLIGFTAGVIIQVSILSGFGYAFVLLSYPGLITFGQLLVYILQAVSMLGLSIPLDYLPIIHSASIPVFYALMGAVVGYIAEKVRRGET